MPVTLNKDTLVPIGVVVFFAGLVSFATLQNQKVNQSAIELAQLKPIAQDVALIKVAVEQAQKDLAEMNNKLDTVDEAYTVIVALKEAKPAPKPAPKPRTSPSVPDGWALDKDGHPYDLSP